ncbi:ketopantoate reductase family protein [Reinekea sp.]|jgi:2-dehydropantoate 2-reductase|uniref:ketopantoate reductase family protein n=2 Tax=Reinekea sp. TaxID=1970455 RepID=UPI003988DB87
MRFLIIGAGGIGCYYGARLQTAGHSVTYLARGEHLQTLEQQGLKVNHSDFDFNGRVDAYSLKKLVKVKSCDQFDLIILTTKGGSTAAILNGLKTWLSSGTTPFLSLQNGVDNEPFISAVIGEHRTLGGLAVRIGGHITAPGIVDVKGVAQIILGPWPNSKSTSQQVLPLINEIVSEFNKAGIPTQMSLDIQYELWRKLIINNGVNPLSALSGLDTKALTSHPILRKTVYTLMEEVASVAKADGVLLGKNDVDEMYNLISTFDAIKTSMLVDKEKGRLLELDSICGAVISRAEKLAIDVPTTNLVNALLTLQK